MFSLRDYQQGAVGNIRASYTKGFKSPLLVLPTGGGKTVVFCNVAATTASKRKKVLILTHRVELLMQTSAALERSGVWHGLINPNFTPDLSAPVQVASVQTMVGRMYLYDLDFDLIIIDEAHHARASTWRKVIDYYSRAFVLGVTATPVRTDGKALGIKGGGLFDDLIIGPTVAYLIERGFLVKPIVYAPVKDLDLSDLDVGKSGDYNMSEAAKKVDKATITGSAVKYYSRVCPGASAVAFCVNVLHAEHVAAEFVAAGYNSCSIDGSMNDETRKRILRDFERGLIHVLTSVDLIGEGFDLPAISCVILLRPTASLGLYIQQVGRALRPVPGKKFAYVLDHVGNALRHGMPEEDREWCIDYGEEEIKRRRGGRNGGMSRRVSQCDSCSAVYPIDSTCPVCGHINITGTRKIKMDDEGELEVLETSAMITHKKRMRVSSAKTIEELHEVAKEFGFTPGWVAHTWKHRVAKKIGL